MEQAEHEGWNANCLFVLGNVSDQERLQAKPLNPF